MKIKDIKKGEKLTKENVWTKRPGSGEIKAEDFKSLLGKFASRNIDNDSHLQWSDVNE